ncbi:hypothetical protein GCK72_019751 [Caenorhabditis remanei]|uniref:BTB domain-containing protein n=1 Tax=Caenorhabditis remanei TaxID=31234 RepID=A0A6A5GET0_CAERE|nr:hypothetical protein GCK72_019751 [Caenorhabditis remanei]KAF1753195.1 hypothetical protein GCK72_019751 [Caenorhabditis remanei]
MNTVILRSKCAGFGSWTVKLIEETINGDTYFQPQINCRYENLPKTVNIRYEMGLGHDNSSYEKTCEGCSYWNTDKPLIAKSLKMLDLLNPESGHVKEDKLMLHVGIHVESIQYSDGIWKFNFYDKLFPEEERKNMITMERKKKNILFYSHMKLIKFHTENFTENFSDVEKHVHTKFDCLEKCLQIAHGVQLQLTDSELFGTIRIADIFGFKNVARYCERRLIQNLRWKTDVLNSSRIAISHNRDRLLTHLLKDLKFSDFSKVFKVEDVPNMSMECMKLCTKFVFDNVDRGILE